VLIEGISGRIFEVHRAGMFQLKKLVHHARNLRKSYSPLAAPKDATESQQALDLYKVMVQSSDGLVSWRQGVNTFLPDHERSPSDWRTRDSELRRQHYRCLGDCVF